MKKKKLILNKETITILNDQSKQNIKGGLTETTCTNLTGTCDSDYGQSCDHCEGVDTVACYTWWYTC